jgi:tetratricopeptide (TPR) repeat protein
METERLGKLLALAKDLANQHTDEGLDKAADVLLHAVDEGCGDPEVLVAAAVFLLQGSRAARYDVKKKAIGLVDKAVSTDTNNIHTLEKAISCYELVLNDFPSKLDDIIKLSLKILDLDPDHVDSMITLANHRNSPGVSLSLADTTRMLEWAREVEPDNVFAAYTLARLYAEARQYQKARTLYQQIMANGSDQAKEAVSTEKQLKSKSKSKNKQVRKYGVN